MANDVCMYVSQIREEYVDHNLFLLNRSTVSSKVIGPMGFRCHIQFKQLIGKIGNLRSLVGSVLAY